MRIEETVEIDAPVGKVWKIVSDPASFPRFMRGLTRWEQVGSRKMGLGARYNARLRVGAGEVGGLIEIIEFVPQRELAWTGITGLFQRGRWRLREPRPGRTRLTVRLAYHATGGIFGMLADQFSAPMVRGTLREALQRVKARAEAGGTPAPGPTAGELLNTVGNNLRAVRVLAEAGVIRPMAPERLARTVQLLARWGAQPGAAYAVGSLHYPDETALIDEAGNLSFKEIHERTNAIAHTLEDAGIRAGDGVAIMCRNHRGFIEGTVAAWKLGATALFLNTSFAGPQLAEVVEREKARALIYDDEFAELVKGARRRRPAFVAWHEGKVRDKTLDQMATGDTRDLDPPGQPGKSVILTSGTTGAPKGASRSQVRGISVAAALLSRIPLRARETTFIAAPLFHSWGLIHFGLGLLLSSTYLLRRKFDPEATLADIERHHPAALVVVPVMMQRIMELPRRVRRKYDTSSLRVVAVSGSLLPGELATGFMDEFGDIVYNLYGSTEVAWATIATPEDLRQAPGTAGRAPLGTLVKLYDDNDREVADGRTGRIFVKNEMMFEGYTGGGSRDMIDGLMATGDIGHFDDAGRLFVEGRSDEMIVSGGENVFPAEIEDLLSRHQAIQEAAVVGVEDRQFGQALRAFVVKKGSAALTEDQVKAYVKSSLAGYKVPKQVVFIDRLPRNQTGKVMKRELVAEA